MTSAFSLSSQDYAHLLLGGSTAALLDATTQQMQLQPVFIPRQQGGLHAHFPLQDSGSATRGGLMAANATASADWAFLMRNAAALRNDLLAGTDAQLSGGNLPHQDILASTTSPRGIAGPGNCVVASVAAQGPSQVHPIPLSTSTSSMLVTTAVPTVDCLGQLSADALMSASGDPSNSIYVLSNASQQVATTGLYPDTGVQTLYANDVTHVAAGAATTQTPTHSFLQQQAAAVIGNAGIAHTLSSGGLAGVSSSRNMSNLVPVEESLSGTLFGPGGTPAALSPKPVSASLYIKNLPLDADKLFLYEKFSPFGAILSVKVLSDQQSGQCRGVGFVNFADHISAVRSIQALHGTKVGDKLLHVSLQTPRLRAAVVASM